MALASHKIHVIAEIVKKSLFISRNFIIIVNTFEETPKAEEIRNSSPLRKNRLVRLSLNELSGVVRQTQRQRVKERSESFLRKFIHREITWGIPSRCSPCAFLLGMNQKSLVASEIILMTKKFNFIVSFECTWKSFMLQSCLK